MKLYSPITVSIKVKDDKLTKETERMWQIAKPITGVAIGCLKGGILFGKLTSEYMSVYPRLNTTNRDSSLNLSV
jgi:hypothetical protein